MCGGRRWQSCLPPAPRYSPPCLLLRSRPPLQRLPSGASRASSTEEAPPVEAVRWEGAGRGVAEGCLSADVVTSRPYLPDTPNAWEGAGSRCALHSMRIKRESRSGATRTGACISRSRRWREPGPCPPTRSGCPGALRGQALTKITTPPSKGSFQRLPPKSQHHQSLRLHQS